MPCCFSKTMTSRYTFRITGPLWGEPSVTDGFPSQRGSNVELWCFFVVSLDRHLVCWWFAIPRCYCAVIKWKHFPRYLPFFRGIHRSPVDSLHKGQWRGALMFSLIWTNVWANNQDSGDLRHHRAHYDVTVMILTSLQQCSPVVSLLTTAVFQWPGSCPIRQSVHHYLFLI